MLNKDKMSHKIIYNRLFVKTNQDENKTIYVPMVLSGSNNCTQINYQGREIRERSWYASNFFTNDKLACTEQEILSNIDNYRLDLIQRYTGEEDWSKYNDENFGSFSSIRFTGKQYVSFKMFRNFYKNGIQTALTVEELAKHDICLLLEVSSFSKEKIEKKGLKVLDSCIIKTSEELVQKTKEYTEYYKGIDCLYMTFNSEYSVENYFKKQKFNRLINKRNNPKQKQEVESYFVLKNNNGFFVKFTKWGYKYMAVCNPNYIKVWLTEKKINTFHDKMKEKENWTITEVREKATIFV